MVFSYKIEINGTPVMDFSGLRIRESVDGMGTSGVSSAELTFSLPPDQYIFYFVPAASEVKLFFVDDAGKSSQICQNFYISSRSCRSRTVSFKCYDRMIKTDKDFSDGENILKNSTVSAFDILDHISALCGFSGYGIEGMSNIIDIPIPSETVRGKSCRELLEMISAAWCGSFRTNKENKLLFVPFGTPYIQVISSGYVCRTEITENNTKVITQVIMSGNGGTFVSGATGSDVLHTLRISSELASQELVSRIMSRVSNITYQGWECPKMLFNTISGIENISPTCEIQFEDGTVRTANYAEKIFTKYGIVVKCGANDFSENETEYKGAYSREISKRISDSEKLGNNTRLTRYQGLIHEAANDRSEAMTVALTEDTGTKIFGYSPATYDGVVQFDGAMTDGIYPEISVADDLSEFSLTYGETKIEYTIEWHDDNNVVIKKKEL